MKKFLFVAIAAAFLTACNSEAVNNTEKDLDSASEKVEQKLEQAWDSTKEGYKDVRDAVDDRIDRTRDSANRRDSADNK